MTNAALSQNHTPLTLVVENDVVPPARARPVRVRFNARQRTALLLPLRSAAAVPAAACRRAHDHAGLRITTILAVRFDEHGDPWWHASSTIWPGTSHPTGEDRARAEKLAHQLLGGVGEWSIRTCRAGLAFHVSKRLTDDERRSLQALELSPPDLSMNAPSRMQPPG